MWRHGPVYQSWPCRWLLWVLIHITLPSKRPTAQGRQSRHKVRGKVGQCTARWQCWQSIIIRSVELSCSSRAALSAMLSAQHITGRRAASKRMAVNYTLSIPLHWRLCHCYCLAAMSISLCRPVVVFAAQCYTMNKRGLCRCAGLGVCLAGCLLHWCIVWKRLKIRP